MKHVFISFWLVFFSLLAVGSDVDDLTQEEDRLEELWRSSACLKVLSEEVGKNVTKMFLKSSCSSFVDIASTLPCLYDPEVFLVWSRGVSINQGRKEVIWIAQSMSRGQVHAPESHILPYRVLHSFYKSKGTLEDDSHWLQLWHDLFEED